MKYTKRRLHDSTACGYRCLCAQCLELLADALRLLQPAEPPTAHLGSGCIAVSEIEALDLRVTLGYKIDEPKTKATMRPEPYARSPTTASAQRGRQLAFHSEMFSNVQFRNLA